MELDERASTAGGPRITVPGSRVSAWVIPTDEGRMIAEHAVEVLGGTGARPVRRS